MVPKSVICLIFLRPAFFSSCSALELSPFLGSCCFLKPLCFEMKRSGGKIYCIIRRERERERGVFSPHHCVGFLFFAQHPPLCPVPSSVPLTPPLIFHHSSSTTHSSHTTHLTPLICHTPLITHHSSQAVVWQAQYTEPGRR